MIFRFLFQHPDKNHAPEAEDAFKLVSSAFQTLSDSQKRAHYDQFGDEAPSHSASHRNEYSRGDDISPEEIFNMFFGQMAGSHNGRRTTFRTNFRPQQQRRQNSQPTGENQAPASFFMQIVHFLPIILLILFSFLSSPSSDSDLPFSFSPTRQMPIPRVTKNFQVDYFVNQNFQLRYGRDYRALATVESRVEQEYIEKLDRKCEEEQKEIEKLKKRARSIRDSIERSKKLEEAETMKAESCEKRRELFTN